MRLIDAGFGHAVQQHAWSRDALHSMAQEVHEFVDSFQDDRNRLSGWGHRYFCPEDGGRLEFDMHKPLSHVCSVCGKQYDGKVYDEAWVVFYRNLAFVTVEKAAVLYKVTGDAYYLDTTKNILSFYTHNYEKFPLHTKEGELFSDETKAGWGCGRIMPQGLNESIVMVRSIMALEILKDDLDQSYKDLFHEKFVVPFYRMIKPQVCKIHNIPCWNLAGLGCAALYFHDQEMIDFVFHGEYNIRRQLAEGVTQDGFWYEGSIHYNFFLLEGVSTLLLFCHLYGVDFGSEAEQTVLRMLQAAYCLAFDNHTFPVPNDGWPKLNLKTFSYVYYMVAKVFGECSLVGNLVKNIESGKEERQTLPLSESYYVHNAIPLERLLFAYNWDMKNYVPLSGKSKVYPASLFAMLRKAPLNLFCKYGLNGPSHAHPDILEFELAYGPYMVSRDLSNAGYYSKICNTWHRKSASHNTITFDGQDITSRAPGKVISFDDDSIKVQSALFDGVDGVREFHITSKAVDDRLTIDSQKKGRVDLFFHMEPDWKLVKEPASQPGDLGYTDNGYEYMKHVRRLESEDGAYTLVFCQGGVTCTIVVPAKKREQVFLAQTPDNPITAQRTTLVRRQDGDHTEFSMHITFKEKEEKHE